MPPGVRAEPTAEELLGILCRVDLSPSARLAWQYLLAETRAGRPFPSLPRLAVALGLHERRTRDLVRELVEAGEIYRPEAGSRAHFPAVDGAPIRGVGVAQETATA